MPNEMTYKAAIIEANRLKSQERMDVDRERLNAAIDKLIVAARFRIKRKPVKNKEGGVLTLISIRIYSAPPAVKP